MVFEIQYTDDHVKEAKTLKFLLELSSKTVKTVRLRKQDNILQLVLRTMDGPTYTYRKEGLNLLLKDLSTEINTEINLIKKCMIS